MANLVYRDHPYPTFLALSALLFLLATLGSDVIARTTVGGASIGSAFTEHAYYALVQPIGTAMLLAPFLLLGWMSASLAKRKNFDSGLGVFLFGTLLLGFMFFSAYQDSQIYMKQRMWTAASLAVGFLPVKSLPVLIICLGFRWLAARKNDARLSL